MRCTNACSLIVWLAMLAGYVSQIAAAAEPLTAGNCGVIPAIPPVPQNAKIFSNADVPDVAAAIQDALDHLKAGDWLVFAPGVYRISKSLIVGSAGVTLFGKGATLLSTRATDGGITVRGDDVAIYGFTLEQASTERQSTPWSGGIAIYDDQNRTVRRVRGSIIQQNVINNAAAAGIFVYSADNFTIAENTVWRSLADGIHVTAGAANGRIIGNKVSQTGDDMIAVVSYAGPPDVPSASERYKDWTTLQQGLNKNIYIVGNHVNDQYWGRGISVVGGSRITIAGNVISRSPYAAGIYLVRETSYRTFGVHDVLIRDNEISDIETTAPSFQRGKQLPEPSGHGAIELGSLQDADELADAKFREAFSVSDVAIVGNRIRRSRFAGIRGGVGAPATVSRVLVRGNTLTNVGAGAVLETHPGLVFSTIRCNDNRLDGVRWSTQCATGLAPVLKSLTVKGATLHCSRNGALLAMGARVATP